MSLKTNSKDRAVFLDRDGVINEVLFHREMGVIETPFTVTQFQIKPGVIKAIRFINQLGLKTVVVSNQPGVAMGHFSKKTLVAMTQKMIRQLKQGGAFLDGVYYCLHHPEKGRGVLKRHCNCRKPKSGLLLKAARDMRLALKKSYLVGDSILDVQAGRRAGCRTFLLAHPKCDLCHLMASKGIKPHFVVKDLLLAARKIRLLEKKSK